MSLAHALSLRVVAEGIETPEQAEYLRQQGCDEGQGFLYSRPLRADAIPVLVRAGLPDGHGNGGTG